MDIIQALIESMPYFRAAIRQDVTLSLIDREKYLYFSSGESLKELKFKTGDPLTVTFRRRYLAFPLMLLLSLSKMLLTRLSLYLPSYIAWKTRKSYSS
ncbi:hypothetical protein SAMN05720606_10785 [Paenibacillus polysaccharolyticus]|uniref:Uncharacterized protein n=1 Tax=Paenibacillus polysaccharolyticus TaxID=582692 RepID=A0A1G5HM51_9BACL|nr:hypothetical protein SAMN05720606_10785 [Paenibacillus polysaccharolyticus]